MHNDEKRHDPMSIDEIKSAATTVAAEMKAAGDALPPEIRARFIGAVCQRLFT